MAYDPYDNPSYSYSADPLDNPGLDALGSVGAYNDDLALGSYGSGLDGLGGSALASGLDSYGTAGGMYDDQLAGGLGGMNLNNDLDDLGGLGNGFDSGGLGSGMAGDFAIPEMGGSMLDSDYLNDPIYGSLGAGGLGLDGLGDLGDHALGLGGSGLNGGYDLDNYGSLGSGLDNYGSLGNGLDNYGSGFDNHGSLDAGLGGYGTGLDGLGGLDGYSAMGGGLNGLTGAGLGLDGLGAGSVYMNNYDLGFDNVGSGLESLGWSIYDSGLGLDGLGGGMGDATLLGGAALAGGALGAAGYAGDHNHSQFDRGLSGGYGAGMFGHSNYDPALGVLGSNAFSHGAYDGYGYGSGVASPTLRYSDLANYENRLYSDQAISAAERESLLANRMSWEALDDSARLAQWNTWDDGYRNRLGVADGYWGSRYANTLGGVGSSMYDPMYAAYGWSQPSYSNYNGYDYSYGMGAPSFYSTNTLASVPYSLSTPVRSYYSDYLNVQDPQALPYWSDDSRWREAADLAYYQQRLAADRALSESERMRRWQQRLEWEALDQEARRLRWGEMAESQREQLGLGLIGSYAGARLGSRGYGMTLPYELPAQLRSMYSPYLSGRGQTSTAYMDNNYARYNDLMAWANALKYDNKLAESERLARWRQRMQWEMLDDAQRRSRWAQMPYKDRAMIGLSGSFWDSKYGLSNFYDPRALRPMRFPVSSTLARMFSPYKSKAYLARALQEGQESAIAFADLVAFENALRADRRLRAEDKNRRWRARIRWQEMNERDRRLRYFQMQEAERRMLGLGLSSFFGRRYAAPLLLNGVRGLPPPRATLPMLRAPLPSNLRDVYAPVLARQPLLSTSALSRGNAGVDPAKNLADRIRYSIAQKTEQLPGISAPQRIAATEQKRRILREMDNDRALSQNIQMSEEDRLRRLRNFAY